MTILSYKGYQGSIEYEDGQLVIQLLHIDDFRLRLEHRAGRIEHGEDAAGHDEHDRRRDQHFDQRESGFRAWMVRRHCAFLVLMLVMRASCASLSVEPF